MTTDDTLSWTRINNLAFAGGLQDFQHTKELSEKSILALAEDRKKSIGKKDTWHCKIVDTDAPRSEDDPDNNKGRTIAFAVWSLGPTPEPDANAERRYTPPEVNMFNVVVSSKPIIDAQHEIMAEKGTYLHLDTLATHPDYQGKGAANMLLDWGVRMAEAKGLRIYVDASRKGLNSYKRFGFNVVKDMIFNRGDWGGQGVDWTGCMVREVGGR